LPLAEHFSMSTQQKQSILKKRTGLSLQKAAVQPPGRATAMVH
jgi:hypothetical protein